MSERRRVFKGQFTIISMIMGFILIALYISLMPALQTIITDTLPSVDTPTGTFLSLVPLIMLFFVLSSVYVQSRTGGEY